MTAPYETVCRCGRSLPRNGWPEPALLICDSCRQEQETARAQMELFPGLPWPKAALTVH